VGCKANQSVNRSLQTMDLFQPKAYQDLFTSICFEQPLVAKERLWSIYSELITVLYKCFYLLPYVGTLVYIVTVAGYSKTTVTVQADNTALLPLCWCWNGCYSTVSIFDIRFRRISKIMVTLDEVICKLDYLIQMLYILFVAALVVCVFIDFLHFAWVVDDTKCIVVTRVCVCVCLSVCPRPYAHTTAWTRM